MAVVFLEFTRTWYDIMSATDKTAPPMIILSGPTRGFGGALFNQLISKAYSITALGRDLHRILPIAKVASAPVELVEVDFAADTIALTKALDSLRRIVFSTSARPFVFISNASTIEPIGQATGLGFSDLECAIKINCLVPLLIASVLSQIAQARDCPLLILNVSSGAAYRPVRGWQAYCTSKAAYKMGLDVLAAENLHVEVVHFDPGVIDTSMQLLIRKQKETDMPEVEAFRAYVLQI